jgi:hypothetical protein
MMFQATRIAAVVKRVVLCLLVLLAMPLTAADLEQETALMQRAYLAYFGRSGDPDGVRVLGATTA